MTELIPQSTAPASLGNCSACLFFESIEATGPDDVPRGRCRHRSPPPPEQMGGLAIWPQVRAAEWCGDWKVRA